MKYLVVAGLEKLCVALDAVPRYSGGRWYRHGDWGCQLKLSKTSYMLDERWGGTGYWRACSTPDHEAQFRFPASE